MYLECHGEGWPDPRLLLTGGGDQDDFSPEGVLRLPHELADLPNLQVSGQ